MPDTPTSTDHALDDHALLTAWTADRDDDAFTRLVERHATAVRATCRRMLGPGQSADDAVQAVFIVLSRRAGQIDDPRRLAAWLHGVAVRICLRERRSLHRRRGHERLAAATVPASADEAASDEAVRARLDEALESLPAGQRDGVVRFFIEGRSQAEIARGLGISEDAAKQRIHYALGKLRRWFARRGIAVSATVLALGFAAEAPAADPLFAAACAQAALHPTAGSPAAILAAHWTATMLIRKTILAAGALLLVTGAAVGLLAAEGGRQPVDAINPLIGASTSTKLGEGKTFPGAALPFGLVQLSPDTITGGDQGPGYSWEHPTIEGFSFIHMSGVGWYGDLGNLQVMPTTGPLQTRREDAKSPFSHDDEVAQAGYYAVGLPRYGVRAEMTATQRAGMLRFTFPAASPARIQIDLARRIGENKRWKSASLQTVTVVDDQTIEGSMYCPSEDGGWGNGGGKCTYTLYFSAQFSRPLTAVGIWDKDQVFPGRREHQGHDVGFYAEFATTAGERIMLKSGISFVSIAGARANLRHDIDHWDFDRVRAAARDQWAAALAGLRVEGGTDAQRTAFFTALYHAQIDPRAGADVDGAYIGGDGKPHRSPDFTYRTVFSGWDVFRSEYPLLALIAPRIVSDQINSLTQLADLSGRGVFGRWDILNCDSGCMIGNPAVSIAAAAYRAGIRDFDVEKAYAIGKRSVDATSREPGLSWPLENAYFDYCQARWAEALGRKDDAQAYLTRSLRYRETFDPTVGWMRGRNADGSWMTWKGMTAFGQGCVETNPGQQGWFVPHDVQGLINLVGRERFLADLTTFFERAPANFLWNDYYNHANEPVHHVPYLFTYAGAPWLTQKWTRTVMDHAYGTGVNGLCGNDDVGQMSAWYVLSAIGLHPVSPVDNIYLIGSPLFTRVELRLDPTYHHGTSFTVLAPGNSPENIYIQSARLNGKPLSRAWLAYDEITAGGTLELAMGPTPNKEWGSAPADLPPSLSGALEIDGATVSPPAGAQSREFAVTVTLRNRDGRPATTLVAVHEGDRLCAAPAATVAGGGMAQVVIPVRFAAGGAHRLTVLGRDLPEVAVTDDVPPQTETVAANGDRRSLTVSFSEAVDAKSAATVANYLLDETVVPDAAVPAADGRSVRLALRSPVAAGAHVLAVTGVADASPQANRSAPAAVPFTVATSAVRVFRTKGEWSDLPLGAPGAHGEPPRRPTFALVPGSTEPRGGERALALLTDGRAAATDDDTAACAWLDGPARLTLDLDAETPVTAVRTYSRHKGERAIQRFALYGAAGGTMPDATAAIPGRGWFPLGTVDTGTLGAGGKHGSAVEGVDGAPLARVRWLLWVLEPPAAAGTQGTFLTEIEVDAAK